MCCEFVCRVDWCFIFEQWVMRLSEINWHHKKLSYDIYYQVRSDRPSPLFIPHFDVWRRQLVQFIMRYVVTGHFIPLYTSLWCVKETVGPRFCLSPVLMEVFMLFRFFVPLFFCTAMFVYKRSRISYLLFPCACPAFRLAQVDTPVLIYVYQTSYILKCVNIHVTVFFHWQDIWCLRPMLHVGLFLCSCRPVSL